MRASNVIVDGSNLAYRTYHATKVLPSPLTDKDGNPTGLLFGFLRSLASLKNRFGDHTIYVVWDGSKGRRKAKYDKYKAHRNSENIFSDGQMDTVKKALPMLGVYQAQNPDEEADDVIASLVRGPLTDHINIVVSTDHDFLQLVSYTTQLLIPKVGNGTEKLYDTDRVIADYGVPPSKIVELRAMLGDTSDNLPGVPSVREKVLKGLLKTYGTVEGIYSSHMAGLTAKEFDKLMAAKTQVLLNRELMALQEVTFSTVEPAPDEAGVRELLTKYDIQPDAVVEPFFKETTTKGFVKTS